eukprot:2834290-Pyramimonas_sp.AAC.2
MGCTRRWMRAFDWSMRDSGKRWYSQAFSALLSFSVDVASMPASSGASLVYILTRRARRCGSCDQSDVAGIEKQCVKLGAGDMYPLLASMLTSRPWDDITARSLDSLHVKPSGADNAVIRGYAQKYMHEICNVLNVVPRQMLLLFKMNDCLRHVDRSLGAPVNTFVVTAEHCASALWREQTATWKGVRAYVGALWDYTHTLLRLRVYHLMVWLRPPPARI